MADPRTPVDPDTPIPITEPTPGDPRQPALDPDAIEQRTPPDLPDESLDLPVDGRGRPIPEVDEGRFPIDGAGPDPVEVRDPPGGM